MRSIAKSLAGLVLFAAIAFIGSGCNNDTGRITPNQKPIARLSNIPPTEDTINAPNPRLSLFWVGDDPDGYIIGYKYRWSYTIGSHVVNGVPTGGQLYHRQWNMVLNIALNTLANKNGEALALQIDTSFQNPHDMYTVYHYFATLPPSGLDTTLAGRLVRGDTIEVEGVRIFASNPDPIRYPVHVNPNSGTFIFDSQDSLNLHTFEVCAVDDSSLVGDPAKVSFFTPKVSPPTTEITSGPDTSAVLVLDHEIDTFKGIQFTFLGSDPNSRTIEYSWNVDSSLYRPEDSVKYNNINGLRWTKWSQSQTALVLASDFADKYARRHKFNVRSRNEFGSIDTVGFFLRGADTVRASSVFNTQYPEWLKPGGLRRILIVNKSYSWDSSATAPEPIRTWYPTSATMEQRWRTYMQTAGVTNFDFVTYPELSFATRGKLGQYSTVIVIGDMVDSVNGKMVKQGAAVGPDAQRLLREYCYIGGNLIVTGWNLFLGINQGLGNEILFPKLLHVQPPFFGFACRRTGTTKDTTIFINDYRLHEYEFAGGDASSFAASLGYPPKLEVDMSRIDTAWHTGSGQYDPRPANHGLRNVWTLNPLGFGEYLYSFRSEHQTSCFDSRNVSVRYQGVAFTTVYFGFPMYYMKQAQAVQAIKAALKDCNEIQ